VDLQRRLVAAAGDLALLGPNCYGVLNYLDAAALWPDGHGGRPVERGVAIVTQSGNLGLNLTMQRRGLPLAYLISGGNLAVTKVPEVIEALLDDHRVTAIGLVLEAMTDVAAFSHAAVLAHERRIPLVVLKLGLSEQGAQVAMSHTSSLAAPDGLCDALFTRLGIARVHDPGTLLETLALSHVHGALRGARIASASCSGGEASLVADLAASTGVSLPALEAAPRQRLAEVLGERVSIGNPLDYHTYIWADAAAQTECFAALMSADLDLHLLVLDLPRGDRCEVKEWETTLEAFVAAQRRTGAPAAVVCSLPEGLPEDVADRLLAAGIAPLHGLADGLHAIRASATIGAAQARAVRAVPGPIERDDPPRGVERIAVSDEWTAKRTLAEKGLRIPDGRLIPVGAAVAVGLSERVMAAAAEIGYPIVLKAVSSALTHKSEAGAVSVGLRDAEAVSAALDRMVGLADQFLVESMIEGVVAELIVGVRHDPQFGYTLTIGAGGVLVELLRDTVTLLLPVGRSEVLAGLQSLRIWPLLAGHRGSDGADVDAVLEAVTAIAEFALDSGGRLRELDVNPLLVMPFGHGASVADALLIWR